MSAMGTSRVWPASRGFARASDVARPPLGSRKEGGPAGAYQRTLDRECPVGLERALVGLGHRLAFLEC
jgi:hypothetical protein